MTQFAKTVNQLQLDELKINILKYSKWKSSSTEIHKTEDEAVLTNIVEMDTAVDDFDVNLIKIIELVFGVNIDLKKYDYDISYNNVDGLKQQKIISKWHYDVANKGFTYIVYSYNPTEIIDNYLDISNLTSDDTKTIKTSSVFVETTDSSLNPNNEKKYEFVTHREPTEKELQPYQSIHMKPLDILCFSVDKYHRGRRVFKENSTLSYFTLHINEKILSD